jgi:uncharacterized protein
MTVVLQHQFFNLEVLDDRFEVELSFDNIPEKLIIPYASVKGFLDPAVQFGLQFEVVQVEDQPPPAPEEKPKDENDDKPTEASVSDEPKVVSLDAFRKK